MNPDPPSPSLDGLRANRQQILDAAAEYGITRVRVFGSVARGQAGQASDVDLLVDFDAKVHGLGPLAGFRDAVAEVLGQPVDVATEDLLRDDIREQAIQDAVDL